ncbi:MAG: substrate-binding domain-containing protein [Nitrospirae bacterium]|nr:substrate-binding domain-containing protein [Nitrospirota bacterium]
MSTHCGGKHFVRNFIVALITSTLICVQPAYAEEVLKIGGTGNALGPMKLLVAAFEKSHPDVKVEVMPSLGSTGGIRAVSKSAIDMGLSSRLLLDNEDSKNLSIIKYAMTPLLLISNPDVTVTGLNTDDILRIYRGDFNQWPDGKQVRLVLRPAGESDTLAIKGMSPEMSKAVDAALSRQGMLIALTDQDCAALVERVSGSVGFSTLAQIISEKRRVIILPYEGILPSVKSLADGRYPLSKSLYLVIKPGPSVRVREFIAFIFSEEGRRILEESGHLVMPGTPDI